MGGLAHKKRLSSLCASPYLFVIPALVLVIGIFVPFLSAVWTSFTDSKLYIAETNFICLKNYIDLFRSGQFQQSLKITVFYSLLSLAVQLPLGLGVAFLLNIPSRMQRFMRVVLVLPLLIPPVVAGLIWRTMMHPTNGILNHLLGLIRIAPLPWLSSPKTALISVVLIDTWVFTPFVALLLLAGLQSIPAELKEAASIDGAGVLDRLLWITIPWLTPHILLVTIFRAADSLKSFDIVYQATRGGPLNATRLLHIMAYEEAIRWAGFGKSMAIIMVLWIMCYAITNILVNRWKRAVEVM